MTTHKINIRTTVSANKNKVWECYTQPKHIINWNFASDDWHCPDAKNNMQVGGKYFARMEAKDGSMGFDFEAVYDEITEGKSFSYTLLDKRKVEVEFNGIENNKTEISIIFEAENQNPIEMQKNGWQTILDNFKKYAESV